MSFMYEGHKKFRETDLPLWEKMIADLFHGSIPERVEITNISEIIKILRKIGTNQVSSHMFLANGGGVDLRGCSNLVEKDCIAIDCGDTIIVKPSKLIYQSFPDVSIEWSYFYLIADRLTPTGLYDNYNPDTIFEELIELRPGVYTDEVEDYEGPLPETARMVLRYFEGSFVIFATASIYNLYRDIFNAYGAPHQDGEDIFKTSIDRISKALKEKI